MVQLVCFRSDIENVGLDMSQFTLRCFWTKLAAGRVFAQPKNVEISSTKSNSQKGLLSQQLSPFDFPLLTLQPTSYKHHFLQELATFHRQSVGFQLCGHFSQKNSNVAAFGHKGKTYHVLNTIIPEHFSPSGQFSQKLTFRQEYHFQLS